MEDLNVTFAWQFENAHYTGGKMQYPHYDLKSTLSLGAEMLNPYIKHGTFLVEFDDCIKTIQGDWFL